MAVTMLATLALQPLHCWAAGDVVDYIEAKEINNPPPSVALDTFDRFEIAPIGMVAPYAGQPANEQAKERLQVNLDERVPPVLAEWNAKAPKNDPPRTLKIEPTIRHVKFVSGKARFWAGAEIGEGTNIAAGAITANYRPELGDEKQRTVIGRDVHTGSHNVFVAPIEIGDGAWIGAGSTITEDVPPGALAIARARQVTKESYGRNRSD